MKRRGTTTFLENLQQMHQFPHLILGFYFSPFASKHQGSLTVGGLNPLYYKGTIRYYPVTDPSYWKVRINQIRV